MESREDVWPSAVLLSTPLVRIRPQPSQSKSPLFVISILLYFLHLPETVLPCPDTRLPPRSFWIAVVVSLTVVTPEAEPWSLSVAIGA